MKKKKHLSYPIYIKNFDGNQNNKNIYKLKKQNIGFSFINYEPKFSSNDIKEFQKIKYMEQLGHKISFDENLGKYYNYFLYNLIRSQELFNGSVAGIETPINNENKINFSDLKSLFRIITGLLDYSFNLFYLFNKTKHNYLFIYRDILDEFKNPNVFYFINKFHNSNILSLSNLSALKSYSNYENMRSAAIFMNKFNKFYFKFICHNPGKDLNNLIFLNYLENIRKMLKYNKYLIFQIFNDMELIKVKNPIGYKIRKLFEDINKQRLKDSEFNFTPDNSEENISFLNFITKVMENLNKRLNRDNKEKIYSFYMDDVYYLIINIVKQSYLSPSLKNLSHWKAIDYPFGELNSTHFVIIHESLDYGVYVLIHKFYSDYWLSALPIINEKKIKNVNKYTRIFKLYDDKTKNSENNAGSFLSFFLNFLEAKKLTNPVIGLRQGTNLISYSDFADSPESKEEKLKILKSSIFVVPENKLIGNLYGMVPIKSVNHPTFDYLMNFIEMAYHHARILCEINNKLENKIQEYETSFIENLIKI
jgi:hypothetical protein